MMPDELIPGKITISKVVGLGDDYMEIRIRDVDASVEFIEVKLSMEDFAQAITGMGAIPCKFEVRGLENVGKKRETEPLKFPIPGVLEKKEKALELLPSYIPDGWKASMYFHSRNSFTTEGDQHYANTTIYRWVDK